MRKDLHNVLADFTDLVLNVGAGSNEVREFQKRYEKDSELQRLFNSVLELRANLQHATDEGIRSKLLNDSDVEQARIQAQARARGGDRNP